MNLSGIILGAAAFFLIGIFHPIVVKAEYHFGKQCWWVFALIGMLCCAVSLIVSNLTLASIAGVAGFSCFWSVYELFAQEKRVKKGWFPENPKRKHKS